MESLKKVNNENLNQIFIKTKDIFLLSKSKNWHYYLKKIDIEKLNNIKVSYYE